MKKIVLTMAAIAALGVAGCKSNTDNGAGNAVDVNATANAANTDVVAAGNDAAAGNTVVVTNNVTVVAGNGTADAVANTAGNAAH